MPLKNAGNYVSECLESIRNQTYANWELIIVNDHSTDDSVSIISSIQASEARIQLIPNKRTGIISALQTALKECQGDFVTRMDADDVMPSNRLELMVSAIGKSGQKSIVTGKVKYFSDRPISEGYQKYETWINERIDRDDHWKWVYRECVIASPNWMVRRKELDELKAFEKLIYPEDYDLVLKWYNADFKVISIPEVTLHWREHENRISRLSDLYNQESFFKLKMKHFVKNEMNESSQLLMWGTNEKGKLVARLLISWDVDFRWMALDPAAYPKGIYEKLIEDFHMDNVIKPLKLLIAVYPDQNKKKEIFDYLGDNGLKMGRDYWFL